MHLVKLEQPQSCAITNIAWEHPCNQDSDWLVNGTPMCDDHIADMASMNSDNEEALGPALDEKIAR